MPDNQELFSKLIGRSLAPSDMDAIFKAFDANKDNVLDKNEVRHMLESLATGGQLSVSDLDKVYTFLDHDQDGLVSLSDMRSRGAPWLSQVLSAPVALVVVDVQNDFITGTLALKVYPAKEDGADVVPVINRVIDQHAANFTTVVYSYDWHPADHISFLDNLGKRTLSTESPVKQASEVKLSDTVVVDTESYGPIEQTMWPRHCVQNSAGAELHPDLKIAANHLKVYKGTDPDIDSYSAFWDNGKRKKTDLFDRLSQLGVRDLVVCGLATDVCVGSTAAHAQELGFRTALLEDACRGVLPDGIAATKARLAASHGIVVRSQQLGDIIDKRERPMPWVVAAVDTVKKLCSA